MIQSVSLDTMILPLPTGLRILEIEPRDYMVWSYYGHEIRIVFQNPDVLENWVGGRSVSVHFDSQGSPTPLRKLWRSRAVKWHVPLQVPADLYEEPLKLYRHMFLEHMNFEFNMLLLDRDSKRLSYRPVGEEIKHKIHTSVVVRTFTLEGNTRLTVLFGYDLQCSKVIARYQIQGEDPKLFDSVRDVFVVLSEMVTDLRIRCRRGK